MRTVLACLYLLLSAPRASAQEPVVLITSPSVLEQLERQGLSFGERIAGRRFRGASNAALYSAASFRDVAERVARDLDEFRRGDPRLGPGMRKVHRLFDAGWLKSPDARFELAGISNRMDRRIFNPGTCGEIRLVYRLAYRTEVEGRVVYSRLPMTVNVVTFALDEKGGTDCGSIARRWIPKAGSSEADFDSWAAAAGGPLFPPLLEAGRLKAVEVNLQSVRWPSTIRGDMAGHAEYVLRVFRPDARKEHLIPAELENTPDIERIGASAELREELLAWLRRAENLKSLEYGVAVMPKKFLAKRAVSIAPRGLSRLANRPSTRLLGKKAFEPATMRRLDDLSCTGCHQARSVAGFHLLGRDPEATPAANALAVAMSPHLAGDLARRRRFVRALAAGETPSDVRPMSERSEGDGGYASHCGLGDPGFAAWTCPEGLACGANPEDENDLVGRCMPASPAVGEPCEPGIVVMNADAHKDRVSSRESGCGPASMCETNHVGFPGGMCAQGCEDLGPDGVCGGIARLVPFNRCLARNRPFEECLAKHVSPAGLRKCGDSAPCRDGYICGKTSSGEGACIPPYFIFQMRVDGHPTPRLEP